MPQNYSTYFSSNTGDINKKITLMKRYTTVDSSGAPKYIWHPICDVMAIIEPVAGREYWFAAQSNREATVRFVIRYRNDITDSMRILYKAKDRIKIYEMTSLPIDVKEEHQYLQLMCNEIENDEGGSA